MPQDHIIPSPRSLLRRPKPEVGRDILVVALTLVTGATDAIGFLRLGGVFTSVMTGNMVLLGVAGARRDAAVAVHVGVTFCGYVIGTLAGARITHRKGGEASVWPRAFTWALIAELGAFAAFGFGWELTHSHPHGTAAYLLITINAIALGIQSSAVIALAVPGLSTTYLTGTLTHLVASLAKGEHPRTQVRSIAILLALIGGAGSGAVVAVHAPRCVPLVPVGSLAFVLIVGMTRFETGRQGRAMGPPERART
jgi:uncharacterized membrane protein YoaK (UPF0700 family)